MYTTGERNQKKSKERGTQTDKKNWRNKPLHGQYPQRNQQADVDQAITYQWLCSVDLKAKREEFIIAAQD